MSRELLDALSTAQAINGAELARRLGITRAAVWKQVERLRALGLPIAAEVGRGYRLPHNLDLLDAARLLRELTPAARAQVATLEVALEIDSTNAELMRRGAQGAASGTVLFAEHQSRGRGRRGRSWHSPFAANVYLSVLWRFDRGLAALQGLSLAVAVALAQALRDLGVPDCILKWPNDVLARGRKLAGILVEVGGEWNGDSHAVIGIGINARMPDPGARIEQPWIDLQQLCDARAPTRHALARAVLERVLQGLAAFAAQGWPAFAEAWRAFDGLRGERVTVHDTNPWTGIAEGVDAFGHLLLRTADGTVHAVSAGEVSVRRSDA
jgi:BirA family biotin operon repressor/biotin-[acetyl-CoA-carboxylase] ligase